jgi:hypothetical protein
MLEIRMKSEARIPKRERLRQFSQYLPLGLVQIRSLMMMNGQAITLKYHFAWVAGTSGERPDCFSSWPVAAETVETVLIWCPTRNTLLKQGVNEIHLT